MYFSSFAKENKISKFGAASASESKVLNELKYLLPWVRYAFGNVWHGSPTTFHLAKALKQAI